MFICIYDPHIKDLSHCELNTLYITCGGSGTSKEVPYYFIIYYSFNYDIELLLEGVCYS